MGGARRWQGDEPQPTPQKALIQVRLHSDAPDGGREKDALEFYHGPLADNKWDDRRIVTEALLALRMYGMRLSPS